VARVDVFAPQFRKLVIRKKIPKTEHASARAVACFDYARADASLLQPIGADQPGGACSDDDDFRRLGSPGGRFENRRHAGARGRGDGRPEKPSAVPPSFLRALKPFRGAGPGPFQP